MSDETPASAMPQPADDATEGATPPGYDWPTHGGYLGCLMGVLASCIVSAFLGSTLLNVLALAKAIPSWSFPVLVAVLVLVLAYLLGRAGWALGRRFYRAYPQPVGPTWGEHDEAEG